MIGQESEWSPLIRVKIRMKLFHWSIDRLEAADWSVVRKKASDWSSYHLHCVQRVAKHQACGPAHPAGYKRMMIGVIFTFYQRSSHIPTKSHQDICLDL